MPRFFFDIDECSVMSRDDEGVDLRDLDQAMLQARITLPAIAREVSADREAWTLRSSVRDESGDVVFEATLNLRTRQVPGTVVRPRARTQR